MTEPSDIEILLSATALAKILTVDRMDTSKESAGLLIGYVKQDTDQLIITDIDTGKQQQTSTFVVMDDEALVDIVMKLQERDSEQTIVGWWHTHPGYGCFLSGTDKNTQRTYQNLFPKAIALVVDPLKYYQNENKKDLDLQFFRMIDQTNYRPVSFDIYIDDIAHHLGKIASEAYSWKIPVLSKEQIEELHKKLESVSSSLVLEQDKKMLHAFIDIFASTEENERETTKISSLLYTIDNRLNSIGKYIESLYFDDTLKLYSLFNILSAIIISVLWIVFALLK
ncbi:MAG: Mov34/MPN/PAD-1 family protein [Candidatus Heimdallarchaeum aukensis]|uniref:Mov34/MPN/PAD-1 family protein n=1 Tax=Candidatus Heimdallarchaeum aukensis TaxID=2876573 RepID=A0A9Y1FMV5_9ARCH|nr:MAG: Mov34/MPN/PAD-1 family protein [Candidatus Heimdallarchaeum aukensis]